MRLIPPLWSRLPNRLEPLRGAPQGGRIKLGAFLPTRRLPSQLGRDSGTTPQQKLPIPESQLLRLDPVSPAGPRIELEPGDEVTGRQLEAQEEAAT